MTGVGPARLQGWWGPRRERASELEETRLLKAKRGRGCEVRKDAGIPAPFVGARGTETVFERPLWLRTDTKIWTRFLPAVPSAGTTGALSAAGEQVLPRTVGKTEVETVCSPWGARGEGHPGEGSGAGSEPFLRENICVGEVVVRNRASPKPGAT